MWQMLRKRLGSREGFTLIELVVVVAILGLLAVIVTPKVMGAIDNAKTNSQKSSAKQLQVAMERYYAEQGKYPETGACTDYTVAAGVGTGCELTELRTVLKNYINLDTATIEDTIPDYRVTAATSTVAASYTLKITFKETGKVYTITADSITTP